ncbi:receptor-like protein 12 [Gossypium australe]|uniref:Receptor-like protein 12 n=1 Tax=Gossypium australe TaxID=47621 RepID=A0A5B6UDI1_9ROSI|nr:receptor-like protein 12 [Gossypium australe]
MKPMAMLSSLISKHPGPHCLERERRSLVAPVLNSCLLQFTYLEHLDLSGNNFQYSPIPQIFEPPWALTVNDVQWISNLSSLQHHGMAGICLGETPSFFQVLNRFPSLLSFHLSQCGLNNSHLSWHPINSSFHGVRHLDLGQNDFPGTVPSMIQNMTSIRFLDLSFNLFITSSIHNSFGNLKNLSHLNIAANAFSGIENGGYVPNWLGMLGNHKHIHLSHNQLNGTVPESLGQLWNLETLDLSYDSLEGSICEVHSASLSKLKTLSIGSTVSGIKGILPRFSSNLNNLISGVLSERMGDMLPHLSSLILSNNLIKGSILNSLHRQDIEVVDQSSNNLSGVVPSTMGHLGSLTWLDLSNNNLSGELSLALKNCTSLRFLYVGGNALSGNVPKWIGDSFGYLRIPRLRGNKFNSSIPWQLC